MNPQPRSTRRMRAIGLTFAMLLICGVFLATPSGRAFADQLLYTIGVFTVSEPTPGPVFNNEPTAAPAVPQTLPTAPDAVTASQLAGFTVLELAVLPDGYAPLDVWTISPEDGGMLVVRGYVNEAGEQLTVNQLKPGPNAAYDEDLSPNEHATPVDINGASGLLIEGRLMGYGEPINGRPLLRPTNWLYWADNGINYLLFADNLTSDQLIEIAEGMQ